MKKLSLICMTVLALSFLASCRGPQGPQGPAGQDGNANVASSTVTIPATFDYPAINSNVFNHGAVLVYMNVNGSWSQLPLTYYYDDVVDGETRFYEASIEVATLSDGGVSLYWTESDFWKVYPGTRTFKIVAIEANLYSYRSDVDYSNYEAVKTAFQLAD